MAPAQVRQVDPPPDVRALTTLPAVDYADAFTVTGGPGECTPEQWARAMLSRAPRPVRFKLIAGWTLLGLRLGLRPPGQRVLGWRIRQHTPDHLLLGAGSRLGLPAELLFRRTPDGLLFATFVRQRSRLARALWPRIIPGHQRTVAALLTHGARRL
ncbi:MAG TPA: hypothetical protein VH089_11840 [Streptosporangiaceae bacterium]|nr:hypothetical protein [Streptosporangiaceae bacterium]